MLFGTLETFLAGRCGFSQVLFLGPQVEFLASQVGAFALLASLCIQVVVVVVVVLFFLPLVDVNQSSDLLGETNNSAGRQTLCVVKKFKSGGAATCASAPLGDCACVWGARRRPPMAPDGRHAERHLPAGRPPSSLVSLAT